MYAMITKFLVQLYSLIGNKPSLSIIFLNFIKKKIRTLASFLLKIQMPFVPQIILICYISCGIFCIFKIASYAVKYQEIHAVVGNKKHETSLLLCIFSDRNPPKEV